MNERAATRAASFVERDVSNRAVLDEKTFHVLSADVEHERNFGTKFLRGSQMSKRFDFGAVSVERGLNNRLAVARGEHARNFCRRRNFFVQVANLFDDDFQRRALVRAVIGVKNFFIVANRANFCRRGARVDSHENFSAISFQVAAFNFCFLVARAKIFVVGIVFEQNKIGLARFGAGSLFRFFNPSRLIFLLVFLSNIFLISF